MREWKFEEAKLLVINVLLESNYAKETDMTEEEAQDLAETICMKLEDTP